MTSTIHVRKMMNIPVVMKILKRIGLNAGLFGANSI